MRAVVLGAAGFVGGHVTEALVSSGAEVVATHRRRATPLTLRRTSARVLRAPLDAPELLADALRGHPTVLHAAAHYPRTSRHPRETAALVQREISQVLEACARAEVRRLVFVSSTATIAPRADGAPSDERHRWPGPPGLGVYHDAKWWMEEQVLQERRFPVVVTCPGGCIGPGDLRLGTQALLVAVATGRCPPLPHGIVNLVDARDVARAVARLAHLDDPPPRTVLVSHRTDLHALLHRLARRHGTRPPAACGAEEALRAADEAERTAEASGGRAVPARELVDLVVHGVPVDGEPSRRALDLAFTPIEQTLDDFDRWARALGLLPPVTVESVP